jgi:hypothetical protein
MKRQFVILCIFFFGISLVYSQQVSFEEAKKTAQNFFGKSQKSLQSCVDIAINKNDTLFYVFNANNGFVVISAEKKATPILAYSDEGVYDPENVIPPVKMWLDYYQSQLSAIRNDIEFSPTEKVIDSWEALEKPSKFHKSTTTPMRPLLTSKWNQTDYYNYYCPLDESSNSNKRALTGCVATAMAQLMYYFRFPQHGSGSFGYEHPDYGYLSADFSQAFYDYSGMADVPMRINGDISLLSYHCGVAVSMEYGPTSSGMTNHSAARVMRTHFGFSDQTQYLFRDSTHLYSNWDSIIVSHLDNKIPLYYAGWSDYDYISGHAFICDAYQIDSNDNYYYHFNFGWSGKYDSYFYTDNLYPSGSDFTLTQELIINAYPDTNLQEYHKPVTTGQIILTEDAGSFTDGSSLYDCKSGIDYTWIIRPDMKLYSITLDISFQLAQGDTIFVTSGDGTIKRIFTDTSSSTIKTSSNELTVRFITTNTLVSSGGLTGSYTTDYSRHCYSSIVQYTDKQGSFDDGSGTYKYNNLAKCSKRIQVDGSSITLYLSRFETEKDKDILYISDYNTKDTLLKLSGSLADFDKTAMTFQTNALDLVFVSDPKNTYNGWELSYATDVPVEINDFNKENNIIIYPNPVVDYLHVRVENILSNVQIQLFDIYGKLIQEQSFTDGQSVVNMNHLASGIYLLKIKENGKTLITQKVIKQ